VRESHRSGGRRLLTDPRSGLLDAHDHGWGPCLRLCVDRRDPDSVRVPRISRMLKSDALTRTIPTAFYPGLPQISPLAKNKSKRSLLNQLPLGSQQHRSTAPISSTTAPATSTTTKPTSTTSSSGSSPTGAPQYAQCGGDGYVWPSHSFDGDLREIRSWTGPTTCVSPYVCTVSNPCEFSSFLCRDAHAHILRRLFTMHLMNVCMMRKVACTIESGTVIMLTRLSPELLCGLVRMMRRVLLCSSFLPWLPCKYFAGWKRLCCVLQVRTVPYVKV
jgi:hypothetical protein